MVKPYHTKQHILRLQVQYVEIYRASFFHIFAWLRPGTRLSTWPFSLPNLVSSYPPSASPSENMNQSSQIFVASRLFTFTWGLAFLKVYSH